MIKLRDVKYAYSSATEYALKGLSLDIPQGSFVALVGHNGSGKSTISKLLNGLLLPTSGDVYIDGFNTKDKQHLFDVRKTVGVVFQNPDNQTVASIIEDDVAFGLENLGVPSQEIRERVDEALRAVGMYEHRKRTPHRLSGGQKQRIAIAGVLAMSPKVIVFDESTSMLDPKGRTEVLDIARELAHKGTTVIMVTHYMEEAALADRIVVLSGGRIVLDGGKEILGRVAELKKYSLSTTFDKLLAFELAQKGVNVDSDNIASDCASILSNAANAYELDSRSVQDNASVDINDIAVSNIATDVASVVEAKGVDYTYSPKTANRQVALQDVNITIERGDLFGIIGHTGSGKSTFVLHLNGLTPLMHGELHVCGIDLSKKYNYKSLRSKVGIVFQYPEYQLFDETVAKDIGFGPKNIGCTDDEIDKRVRDSLELVGLDYDKIADKSPFELSGGQKRRVALAGIIAMKPDILILDEPTAGLDPNGKREILALIAKLRKECIAVVMISHNMDEIAEYCNKVAVFDSGRVVLEGSRQEVFAKGDYLVSLGLDIPQVVKFASELTSKGVDIDKPILDMQSLVEYIASHA